MHVCICLSSTGISRTYFDFALNLIKCRPLQPPFLFYSIQSKQHSGSVLQKFSRLGACFIHLNLFGFIHSFWVSFLPLGGYLSMRSHYLNLSLYSISDLFPCSDSDCNNLLYLYQIHPLFDTGNFVASHEFYSISFTLFFQPVLCPPQFLWCIFCF